MNVTFRLNESSALLPASKKREVAFEEALKVKVLSQRSGIVKKLENISEREIKKSLLKKGSEAEITQMTITQFRTQRNTTDKSEDSKRKTKGGFFALTQNKSTKRFVDFHKEIFERTAVKDVPKNEFQLKGIEILSASSKRDHSQIFRVKNRINGSGLFSSSGRKSAADINLPFNDNSNSNGLDISNPIRSVRLSQPTIKIQRKFYDVASIKLVTDLSRGSV